MRDALSRHEEAEELLLMGLRLKEGVRLDRLAALTGYRLAPAAIAPLAEAGLLDGPAGEAELLMATAEGRLVLNSVIAELANGLEPLAAVSTVAPSAGTLPRKAGSDFREESAVK
jgi:oxygen-independent coproporphyrinogen-3 oxidase